MLSSGGGGGGFGQHPFPHVADELPVLLKYISPTGGILLTAQIKVYLFLYRPWELTNGPKKKKIKPDSFFLV